MPVHIMLPALLMALFGVGLSGSGLLISLLAAGHSFGFAIGMTAGAMLSGMGGLMILGYQYGKASA